ncbi:MAG: lysophospholipid acyltransferase family protein [Candidatus Cloacimonadota bacterium]|nr:lysophospholipid acyltransferase family protein [Candidatus Cloacimonadota bacterium]
MKNKLEFLGFIFFVKIFKIIPYNWAEWILKKLFIFGGYYLGIRKNTAEKNLKMVFPNISAKRRKEILKSMYAHLGITTAETYLASFSKLLVKVNFEGKENIERALASQKGAIIATGHFGSWELAGRAMARHWNVAVVIKKQRNTYFNDYTNKIRAEQGIRIIYKKRALRNIIKSLRSNYLVCLLTDQNARKSGVRLDFLGKPASVFIGAAKISIRTGAPVIPAVAMRKEDGSHVFRYEKPLYPDEFKKTDDDIKKYTLIINKTLEKYIKKYPEQWFWVHRRWRGVDKARK